MSQLFASGGQSTGVSASTSVLPMNIQDWFPLGWMVGSPCSPRDSKSLLQHHSSKASILWCSAFFIVQLSNPYMTTGKIIALTRRTFVGKVMSLPLICCLGWSPLNPHQKKKKKQHHRSVASLGGAGGVRLHRQPLFKNKHKKLPLGVEGGGKWFHAHLTPEIWYRQRLSDESLVTGTLEELGTHSCYRGYSAWSFFQILIPNRHRAEAQPSLRWISAFRDDWEHRSLSGPS